MILGLRGNKSPIHVGRRSLFAHGASVGEGGNNVAGLFIRDEVGGTNDRGVYHRG